MTQATWTSIRLSRLVVRPTPFAAHLLGGLVGGLWGIALFAASFRGFALTGTQIPLNDIIENYLGLLVVTCLWQLVLATVAGAVIGTVAVSGFLIITGTCTRRPVPTAFTICVVAGLAVPSLVAWRLLSLLREEPSSVVAVWPFADSRLHVPALIAAWSTFGRLQTVLPFLIAGLITAMSVVALVGYCATWVRSWRCLIAPTTMLLVVLGPRLSLSNMSAHSVPDRQLPNIVVLASDSLRADRLGSYGYRAAASPNIDALARRGIIFDQAYVPLARTRVSLVSMFTGLYPHHHGVRETWWNSDGLNPGVGNYVDVFNRAGYYTGVVGDWAATDLRDHGFGFTAFDAPGGSWNVGTFIRRGTPQMALTLSLLLPERLLWALAPGPAYSPGRYTGKRMLDDLRREIDVADRRGQPFFLFSFGSITHGPVSPTGVHLRDALQQLGSDAGTGSHWTEGFGARTVQQAVDIVGESGVNRRKDLFNATYDAAVRTFDDYVGEALSFLKDRQTIVVILSDHGVALFENSTYGQGNWLGHDVENRIPLIIYDPRAAQPIHVPEITSSVDIMPTLAGLVGLSADWPTDGVDRLARWKDEPARDSAPQKGESAAFMETGVWLSKPPWSNAPQPNIFQMVYVPWELGVITLKPEYRATSLLERHRAIRTAEYRLVFWPHPGEAPTYLLYDILHPEFDPERAADHPRFKALKQRLLTWISQDPLLRVDGDRLSLSMGRRVE